MLIDAQKRFNQVWFCHSIRMVRSPTSSMNNVLIYTSIHTQYKYISILLEFPFEWGGTSGPSPARFGAYSRSADEIVPLWPDSSHIDQFQAIFTNERCLAAMALSHIRKMLGWSGRVSGPIHFGSSHPDKSAASVQFILGPI